MSNEIDLGRAIGLRLFKAPSYWADPNEWWCDAWVLGAQRTFHAPTRADVVELGRKQLTEWLTEARDRLAALS